MIRLANGAGLIVSEDLNMSRDIVLSFWNLAHKESALAERLAAINLRGDLEEASAVQEAVEVGGRSGFIFSIKDYHDAIQFEIEQNRAATCAQLCTLNRVLVEMHRWKASGRTGYLSKEDQMREQRERDAAAVRERKAKGFWNT